MESELATVIEGCTSALKAPDPQSADEDILLEAARNPAIARAISGRTKFASLEDLAIHRSEHLTLLAGAMPPGFSAGPHNHNLWSVVSVCDGQEDNQFFERDGDGLKPSGEASVVAPGVLSNGVDVIHAIRSISLLSFCMPAVEICSRPPEATGTRRRTRKFRSIGRRSAQNSQSHANTA